ncbi:MAG TPA: type II toxin-antitoxin system VapC family toxin [Longimicrobiaceae bacterium]|nr:type II toxin-antitoxin system VapC family toxin [Longimicrobiaceae bacterium]
MRRWMISRTTCNDALSARYPRIPLVHHRGRAAQCHREQAIRDGDNEPVLSAASAWEIAIKVRLGRLPISEPLESFITDHMERNRIQLLPVELHHTFEVARLPLHHRDPFDRLLVCQARAEELPLVTADAAFSAYGVDILW